MTEIVSKDNNRAESYMSALQSRVADLMEETNATFDNSELLENVNYLDKYYSLAEFGSSIESKTSDDVLLFTMRLIDASRMDFNKAIIHKFEALDKFGLQYNSGENLEKISENAKKSNNVPAQEIVNQLLEQIAELYNTKGLAYKFNTISMLSETVSNSFRKNIKVNGFCAHHRTTKRFGRTFFCFITDSDETEVGRLTDLTDQLKENISNLEKQNIALKSELDAVVASSKALQLRVGRLDGVNSTPRFTANILSLQSATEYYEFMKGLQKLTSFPQFIDINSDSVSSQEDFITPGWFRDDTGVYLADRIQIGVRKLKLGIAMVKEPDNLNISCFKFDDNNLFVRATDSEGHRFNMLDREVSICGDVVLYREYFSSKTSQGLNSIWLPVFPFQPEVAKKIVNNENWKPSVFYRGSVSGRAGVVSSSLSSSSPENAKLEIVVGYTRIDETNKETGTGSGFGITKKDPVKTQIYEEQQSVTIDGVTSEYRPRVRYVENDIDSIPIGYYDVFQVQKIANDRNIIVLTNNNNGELTLDNNLRVLFDEASRP
jgi:hypothetical protein